MSIKFTAETLAKMGALLIENDARKIAIREAELENEALAAGVFEQAVNEGLTLDQWNIVRNPKATLKAAVLAAGDKS